MLAYQLKHLQQVLKNKLIDDITYTKRRFRRRFGFELDLSNPKSFNAKINALKLSDECYKLGPFVDKVQVRQHVEKVLGPEYLVGMHGHYSKMTPEIYAQLPNQFALKGTHGSAMNMIVYDKSQTPYTEVKKKTSKWLTKNFYLHGREKAYRYVQPNLVVEELMLENGQCPPDYKIFCFHGEPKFIQVDYSRFNGHRRNVFDLNGRRMPIVYKKPIWEEVETLDIDLLPLIEVARKLSKPFNFVRVDLYLFMGQIKFGELTFTPVNGFGVITPFEYDLLFGSYLNIDGQQGFIEHPEFL